MENLSETETATAEITDDTSSIINKDADELVTDFKKLQSKNDKRSKVKKLILLSGAIVILTTIFIALMLVLKLDGKIFPAKLSGMIEDYAQRPVADAVVCVQSKCVITDNVGIFEISDLVYGKYNFTIEANYFRPYNQEIEINRGENKINIALEAKGVGDISGKLQSNEQLILDDLIMKVGKAEVTIAADNTFEVRNLTTGEYLLEIKSPNYIDVSASVSINEGSNRLPEITLQPALDFKLNVEDWLSGKAIKDFTLIIDGKERIIDENNSTLINDIPYAASIEFVIKASGYNDKKFQFTDLIQGINDLGVLNITAVGKTVFVSERLGFQNIYVANYDGSAEQMLTDNKADAVRPVFIKNDSQVAFLSTRDGIKDSYGSLLNLPYVYDYKTSKINRLASVGANYYSFEAMLKADILSFYENGIHTEELWIANIDGSNSFKAFEKQNGYITNIVFANNGEFVAFSWVNYINTEFSGVYTINLKDRELRFVYAAGENTAYVLEVSANRKSLLLSQNDKSTNTYDLFLLDINSKKTSRVTNSSAAKQDARFGKNSDYIYYISTRDGKADIYRTNTNGKNEVKLTTDGKVASFALLNDEIISYTSGQALYIIDSNRDEPVARKITASVRDDSFSMNQNYYLGY